ncbi:MAG: recombinase family protein [Clostridia bacterium]|nr:recombinase family protein [Clostridia bacterium]
MDKAHVGVYINPGEFSVEEQKQKLQTWASENEAKIYDYYIDQNTDQSVPLDDRKEFKRLLGDIRNHKIDSILTVDYDRLASDKQGVDDTLNSLESEGVRIYSISDTIRG